MLDKALIQRLESKATQIKDMLIRNNYDWEETTYQLIAKNFGFKINSDAFWRLASVLSLKILQKHRDNLLQIEALLFGQSGLLDKNLHVSQSTLFNDWRDANEDYIQLLKREYSVLAYKYSLNDNKLSVSEWKFLRLRPANFPTIRISQFASLIYKTQGLFSTLINTTDVKQLYKLFDVKQSDYWKTHYVFGKKSKNKTMQVNIPEDIKKDKIPGFGKMSSENLIINTVAPLLVCYAKEKDKDVYIDKAVKFLEQLPGEKNHIINYWQNINLPLKTAFDTQAGIELYNSFCKQRKCLRCNIGTAIMRQ